MTDLSDSQLDDLLRRTLDRLVAGRRVPASTYRLQFHKGFTFRDAAAIVPYLHALGITHCYASPYLKATPGSTHGYDVVDHSRLNDELGTREDFDAWVKAMADVGMSHILDIVPNHMGVGSDDNALWNDLLRSGKDGPTGRFFDVAWDESPRPELKDRVLLPTLGEPYGVALEKGQLKVERRPDGSHVVAYFDRQFPLDPKTCEKLGDLATLNGTPGDPRSFDALHALLTEQHYRLAYWRTASDEINYRRFFDVTALAALAMERPEVFEEAHALIFDLLVERKIGGLRVDHSDGLWDPHEYLERLQREYVVRVALREIETSAPMDAPAPTAGRSDEARRLRDRAAITLDASALARRPLYVVVEKILAPSEPLPRAWPIDGTSGYDVLNEINGLFVDPAGLPTLDAAYRNFVGADVDADYHELAYNKKRQTLANAFAGEMNLLAHQLDRLAQLDRHSRDFTLDVLRDALTQTIACFGVYRTYVTAGVAPSARDVAVVDEAIARAKARDPSIEPSVFDFVRDALLVRNRLAGPLAAHATRFAQKFQQLTSPVTAKGLEDTAFYIYHRLISLNEVGGEPDRPGVSPDALHAYLAERQRDVPDAMTVLSTHDTKRSEDVRARLHALSELPDEWSRAVGGWHALNRADGVHPNDAYLLYQTLIGAWPADGNVDDDFRDRILAYMLKAMREAKVRTSWVAPDEAIEAAMAAFIKRLLHAEHGRAFRQAFLPFQQHVARIGAINALAQTLIRLTAPGVPDTYQGTELWDLSLVDPDNRRPVDYGLRTRLLADIDQADPATLAERWQDGHVKLLVTSRALRFRRDHADLFTRGAYVPLKATGGRAASVFAFARVLGDAAVIVVVPRLIGGAIDEVGRIEWGDTALTLPDWLRDRRQLRDVLASTISKPATLRLADVLGRLPVALLASDGVAP